MPLQYTKNRMDLSPKVFTQWTHNFGTHKTDTLYNSSESYYWENNRSHYFSAVQNRIKIVLQPVVESLSNIQIGSGKND